MVKYSQKIGAGTWSPTTVVQLSTLAPGGVIFVERGNVYVKGTLNVLNACRSEGVGKIVHTSTSEVYGTALYVPVDEKHPLRFKNTLGPFGKASQRKLQRMFAGHRFDNLSAACQERFETIVVQWVKNAIQEIKNQ